jgi:hypothetical protein
MLGSFIDSPVSGVALGQSQYQSHLGGGNAGFDRKLRNLVSDPSLLDCCDLQNCVRLTNPVFAI